MRITIHGHRPAFLRSNTGSRPAPAGVGPELQNGEAGTPGTTVRSINLGFFKLKIHRQTAVQSNLVAQHQARQQARGITTTTSPTRAQSPATQQTPDRATTGAATPPPAEPVSPRALTPMTASPPISLASPPTPTPPEVTRLTNSQLITFWNTQAAQAQELQPMHAQLPGSAQTWSQREEAVDTLTNTHLATPDAPDLSPLRPTRLPNLTRAAMESPPRDQTESSSVPSRPPTPRPRMSAPLLRPVDAAHLPSLPPLDSPHVMRFARPVTQQPPSTPTAGRPRDGNAGFRTPEQVERVLYTPPQNSRRPRGGTLVESELMSTPPRAPHPRSFLAERGLGTGIEPLQLRVPAQQHFRDLGSFNPLRSVSPPPSLGRSVAAWAGGRSSRGDETAQQWEAWANEPGANAFMRFLDRLGQTVNARDPQFRASVSEWLNHLAQQPELRQNSFLVSEGATVRCEDRVSLTFNAMRKLRVASDVAQGAYDERLPELISMARGMFRLDKLERIARDHAASLVHADEIEVYLAYQVHLRVPLSLPIDTAEMRFFDVSDVTLDDIQQAQSQVLAAEQLEFAHYLSSDWQPWQAVMQRLAPEAFSQAQDELIEAMGDDFNTRLQNRLQAVGLQNDPDAERTLGPEVRNEIAREINGRLTREILASRGLLDQIEVPSSVSPPQGSNHGT